MQCANRSIRTARLVTPKREKNILSYPSGINSLIIVCAYCIVSRCQGICASYATVEHFNQEGLTYSIVRSLEQSKNSIVEIELPLVSPPLVNNGRSQSGAQNGSQNGAHRSTGISIVTLWWQPIRVVQRPSMPHSGIKTLNRFVNRNMRLVRILKCFWTNQKPNVDMMEQTA